MRKLLPVVALAVASVVLVGCTVQPNSSTSTGAAVGTNGASGSGESSTGTKSSSWPSDIPTIDAGFDFSYAKLGETYYLQYKVNANKNAREIAADIKVMFEAAGWTLPTDAVLESDEAVVHSYEKGDNSMTMSVGEDDDTTSNYSISIIAGPKTQAGI